LPRTSPRNVQGLLRATKDDCREGTCLLPTGAV